MQKAQAQAQARKSKTVAFSDVYTTVVVDASPKEETWYTHEETAQMQLGMLREILRISRLVSTSPESFTRDHQLQCVGIESYVVPAVAMLARQERRRHVGLILRAQQVYTDKDLSILSTKSSTTACRRAYVFANSM